MCQKRAAELFDEELFKDPPPREECPICMLPLPFDADQHMFKTCCGMTICNGCILSQTREDVNSGKERKDVGACPFCRAHETENHEEVASRINTCIDRKNGMAMTLAAKYCIFGEMGFPRDWARAHELLVESSKLGCAPAHYALGNMYNNGMGVGKDVKKAKHYYGLAAIGGHIDARHNVAAFEELAGNLERAYKHYVIGAKAGDEECLKKLKKGFQGGFVTKTVYTEALRCYQKQQEDTKSVMRDEALAYDAR